MPNISQIQVGSTTYDIQAAQLAEAKTINGVAFDGSANISDYGVSSTAAGTITKTVSVTGFALAAGAQVKVKFTNAQEADSVLLNVSSTGAKTVMLDTATAAGAGAWGAGEVVTFVYDGTNYIIAGVTKGEMDTKLEDYALTDGAYENMTVGNAEQLVSTVMTEDKVPYVFRTSGGSADIGNRENDMLVGGTVGWNQLVQNGNFASTSWWIPAGANLSVASNIGTVKATTYTGRLRANIPRYAGHKYFVTATMKSEVATSQVAAISFDNGNNMINVYLNNDTNWAKYSTIIAQLSDNSNAEGLRLALDYRSSGWDNIYIKDVMLIDLTQMFGTEIADYIYGLEQANAGDGVAYMTHLFPKLNGGYYPYCAPTLLSVANVSSHNMVGFNQFGGTISQGTINGTTGADASAPSRCRTNFVSCFPSTTYGANTTNLNDANKLIYEVFFYDINQNFISFVGKSLVSATFTTPANCYYLRITMRLSGNGNTVPADWADGVCINLSWSGYRNGEYESYRLNSYPLDSSLTLRGLPKKDADGNLYYDGDEYASDGTVTRRYGIVDLGTLDWNKGQYFSSSGILSYVKIPTAGGIVANIICPVFITKSRNELDGHTNNSISIQTDGLIVIYSEDYSDAATFKTAMSGVYLVYELATPTTESATPYQYTQIVDDFGTEEYVTTEQSGVKVPVGHRTFYQQNLRDKLQHLPDLADSDGTYLIHQSSSKMSLTPVNMAEYAKVNGSYDDLTSGSAKQLISDVSVNNKTPYTFRHSGDGAGIGDREYDTLVGGDLAWNQLFGDNTPYKATISRSGANATVTWNGTADTKFGVQSNLTVIGHKYLVSANLISVSVQDYTNLRFGNESTGLSLSIGYNYYFIESVHGTTVAIFCDSSNMHSGDNFVVNYQLFDLTAMFGTTIADYIYSLEQSVTGAGLSWFKKLFPKPYYEYCAPTLKAVSGVSAHNTTGFNQWDEEWELVSISSVTGQNSSDNTSWRSKNYVPVLPNTVYYTNSVNYPNVTLRPRFYDYDKQYIGYYAQESTWTGKTNTTFTTPSNCYYMRFAPTIADIPDHLLCINFSDASKNGTYEPYRLNSYPLDSSLTLRGIPKLDANNNLYYDGDIYEADGTVTRKYGYVDMGTLSWEYVASWHDTNLFYLSPSSISALGLATTQKCAICSKYPTVDYNDFGDKRLYVNSSFIGTAPQLGISDESYSSAATFKTAMSGVYLVYELATPTTETAEPYTSPQIVDICGTEEYVIDTEDDVLIPVGHSTDYPANLRAKIENAPDSPASNGDYIMRRSGGTNSYVPLTLPVSDMPAAPSSNGTYALQVTVSGVTATYSWDSV